jgi:excisionase family DNA binding protein
MPGKRWTIEDEDFLKEKVCTLSFPALAKRLGRSVNAIEVRVRRLGIENTKLLSGKLTANELAMALNIDNHTVYRWIENHGLKAVRKVTRQVAKFNLISVEDFWKWAEQNKEKINFTKIDPLVLLPEPKWVEEERKRDYHTIPKRQAAQWTDEEDKRLISLLNGNYTQKEIGEFLNRSENAVQRRVSRLRERRIIPKKKITLRWTRKEVQMFLALESQGLSDDEIAFELGRERIHIVDKRRNMRKYGDYRGRKRKVSS